MTFLPVVSREMSVAARRKGTYWWRVGAAFVGVLTLAWLFLVSAAGMPLNDQGKVLFTFLSGLTFVFALMVGVVFTSDALSEEKREGTLGLLFLTDLKGHDVAVGKLTASSVIAAFAVLGIVPMISLTLLLGGITLSQVGFVALLVLNTLLLSLGAGIFISCLSRNERRAMFGTLLLIFLIAAGPYGVSAYAYGIDNPQFANNEFLSISPIFCFWLTLQTSTIVNWKQTFLTSLGAQHILAWILLILASIILPRVAHDAPGGKVLAGWQRWVARWNYGAGEKRVRYRARLLDKNAFSWLAGREKVKSSYVWGTLLFFVILWYWMYRQFPNMAFDLPIVGSLLFLVHFILKIWAASEVSRRMIEDRRSGALELLLSTPLTVKQIARGQDHALWRLFGLPVVVLVVGELILGRYVVKTWYAAETNREIISTFALGIGSLLLDLWALKWVAMWRSLFGRSIGKVLVTSLLRILLLPWLLFAVLTFLLMLVRWLTPGYVPRINSQLVWAVSAVACALFFALPARWNFYRHFRQIAAQRFDARAQKAPGWSLLYEDLVQRLFRRKSEERPRSFLRRHWAISSAAALLLFLVGTSMMRQAYWSGQVATRLKALERQGYATTPAQFDRLYPKALKGTDASDLLLKPVLFGGNINLLQNWPAHARLDTNLAGICQKTRAMNRTNIAELKKAKNYTTAWFDLSPQMFGWGSFWSIQVWFNLLQVESALAVHEGRMPEALEYAEIHLHLLKLLGAQPFTESISVQSEGIRCFAQSLGRVVSHLELAPEQLSRLHQLLGQTQPADDRIVKAFRGDFIRGLAALRAEPETLQGMFGVPAGRGPEQALFAVTYGFAARTGGKDKLLAQYLEIPGKLEALVKLPFPDRARRAQNFQRDNFQQSGFALFQLRNILAAASWPLQGDIAVRTQFNLLRTVVAVEHYRARHGRWPEGLAELELSNDRSDPFSGKELIYRPFENGYKIYSIGTDFEDDNGEGGFQIFGRNDIVFSRTMSN